MHQTVIGNDVRHREHPRVALLGEHVDTDPGQRPVRRDELVVHPVHPAHHRSHTGEIQPRHRRSGEHPGGGAGGHERPDGIGVELHVGVEVQPGKRAAGRVAQAQRVRLAGSRGFDDPHPGHRSGGVGRGVDTRVGHHDDIELTGRAASEQSAQVGRDDRGLVVCRYHDADCRLTHAAQDNRQPDGERP